MENGRVELWLSPEGESLFQRLLAEKGSAYDDTDEFMKHDTGNTYRSWKEEVWLNEAGLDFIAEIEQMPNQHYFLILPEEELGDIPIEKGQYHNSPFPYPWSK